jgi:hypothetical protein
MIKSWISSNYEKVVYISPDGVSFNMHDPTKKAILYMTGWGLPAANIADTKGPFQHGSDPLTIRLPNREITMTFRYNGCSRDEFWGNRSNLINALRLNRTNLNNPSPGHLRWYRSDGTIRQADVFVSRGPDFEQSRRGWDEHSTQDDIKFIALNPILYDPNQRTAVFTDLGCTLLETLQFPFSFDNSEIIFGGSTCNAVNTITVNYLGNWQEYPYITIIGPADNFIMTHIQTGLKIDLTGYSLEAGHQILVDLRYGRKIITLDTADGTSLLGNVSDDSSLGNFAIEPDPVVTNGTNNFSVSIDNGTAETQVVFQYYNRYVAI